jgi:hypothetical protein
LAGRRTFAFSAAPPVAGCALACPPWWPSARAAAADQQAGYSAAAQPPEHLAKQRLGHAPLALAAPALRTEVLLASQRPAPPPASRRRCPRPSWTSRSSTCLRTSRRVGARSGDGCMLLLIRANASELPGAGGAAAPASRRACSEGSMLPQPSKLHTSQMTARLWCGRRAGAAAAEWQAPLAGRAHVVAE